MYLLIVDKSPRATVTNLLNKCTVNGKKNIKSNAGKGLQFVELYFSSFCVSIFVVIT